MSVYPTGEQECGTGMRGKATLATEKPTTQSSSAISANATLNLEHRSTHPSLGCRVTGGWGDKSVYPTGDQEYGSGLGDQTPRPLPHRANFFECNFES